MTSAVGVIFSNLHDSSIPELTARRTMASVPFGCRYRLIDFPLSNMVNSGISKVGVVVHDNYRSLMDHISTGKDWDLARRSGGIKILPPFITAFGNSGAKALYKTRLEAIIGIGEFILRCDEEVVVFSDCDTVCNIDIAEVVRYHKEKRADVTFVCAKAAKNFIPLPYDSYYADFDTSGRISELSLCTEERAESQIITNVVVMDRLYLLSLINMALAHGYSDLYRDLLSREVKTRRMFAFSFDGCILRIDSLRGYYSASMSLLIDKTRNALINEPQRPIYTKVRNSAPTIYKKGASVKNSYIADGCDIEGEVENSIIFRGVKISRGARVENSIILQNSYVGEKSFIRCAILDKDVMIKTSRMLSGYESMPFYVLKGAMI